MRNLFPVILFAALLPAPDASHAAKKDKFPVQLEKMSGRQGKLLFKATWDGDGQAEVFWFKTWYEVPAR